MRRFEEIFDDDVQPRIRYDAAFLTIGYAFLAYRGLSRTPLPRRRGVRIPPS
ncbi:MAG: hypothetical protein ABI559_08410 [Chloroflexota bacterium]